MKDQHSTSDDQVPATPEKEEIDDEFPEYIGGYGTPAEDWATYWARLCKEIDEKFGDDYYVRPGSPTFTVDEMRAAGALDCPPELRKSLRVKRDQLPLFDDEDGLSEEEQ